MHNHQITVETFTGISSGSMETARKGAVAALQKWYSDQNILFTGDGSSVFHFGTAAYKDGSDFVFIITVFDTRTEENRRP